MDELDDPELDELDDPKRENERTDHDFRTNRAARHVAYLDEARDFAHRMIEGNIGRNPG